MHSSMRTTRPCTSRVPASCQPRLHVHPEPGTANSTTAPTTANHPRRPKPPQSSPGGALQRLCIGTTSTRFTEPSRQTQTHSFESMGRPPVLDLSRNDDVRGLQRVSTSGAFSELGPRLAILAGIQITSPFHCPGTPTRHSRRCQCPGTSILQTRRLRRVLREAYRTRRHPVLQQSVLLRLLHQVAGRCLQSFVSPLSVHAVRSQCGDVIETADARADKRFMR